MAQERIPKFIVFLPLYLGIGCIGCSTTHMKLESNPVGAVIKVKMPDQSIKTMGNTPLDITTQELAELGNEILEISIEKDGYETYKTMMAPSRMAFDAKLSVNLKEALGSDSKTVEEICSDVADATANIMQSINRRDFVEAQRLVSAQMIRFPRASVFLDLQGNIFYLQKRVDDAVAAYKSSLKLNPQNQQTKKILEKLISLHGSNVSERPKSSTGEVSR